MDVQQLYKWGKVIASDEEVDDYGGGLCGAATAIYQ
jgi:vancomycin resistance protein YoaR